MKASIRGRRIDKLAAETATEEIVELKGDYCIRKDSVCQFFFSPPFFVRMVYENILYKVIEKFKGISLLYIFSSFS